MKASVRAFFKEIIDYAGLFPPAELSLDTSIHNYRDYRNSPEAWMLSRYVIPASRLGELKRFDEELFQESPPYDFSVLGKGTETASEFFDELQHIGDGLSRFHQDHGNRVTTDVLEIKLPREVVLAHDTELLLRVLEEVTSHINGRDGIPTAVFFEAYIEESWKNDISHVLQVLYRYSDQQHGENISFGFKIRCGGVKASMFPSPEQLAYILRLATQQDIPVKCTAGLHHPVRHYADSVKTKMHGFLNVFGGAMLHAEHDLPEEELVQILNEEDPDHFTFTEDFFQWKDKAIKADRIRELRQSALISFGSCSFDEPREDLRTLGVI